MPSNQLLEQTHDKPSADTLPDEGVDMVSSLGTTPLPQSLPAESTQAQVSAEPFPPLIDDDGLLSSEYLLYMLMSEGTELPPEDITKIEARHGAVMNSREDGGSVYFVESGRAVRFDVPTHDVSPEDVEHLRAALQIPRIETLIPLTNQAVHVQERIETRDVAQDCVALTYNGRNAYQYQGQELVLGPEPARTLGDHLLSSPGVAATSPAEQRLAVSDANAYAIISSPDFQTIMKELPGEALEHTAYLHDKHMLARDRVVEVRSIGIDSVTRNAHGEVRARILVDFTNTRDRIERYIKLTPDPDHDVRT